MDDDDDDDEEEFLFDKSHENFCNFCVKSVNHFVFRDEAVCIQHLSRLKTMTINSNSALKNGAE
jgi:hypothetical protein